MGKTNIQIVQASTFLKDNTKLKKKSPHVIALLSLKNGEGFATVRQKLSIIRNTAHQHKIPLKTKVLANGNVFVWRKEKGADKEKSHS